MKKNTSLNLFNSSLNNKFKSIPFKTRSNDLGEVRYLPPVSKEWKNTVYSYSKNDMRNLPVYNSNANEIIKGYFNLFFKDHKFLDSRFTNRKKQREFIKRIYVSNIETKHTNSKIIVTLHTINVGKNTLHRNYRNLSRFFDLKILSYWTRKLNKKIKTINLFMKQKHANLNNNNLLVKFNDLENKKKLFILKYKLLSESLSWYNLYLKLYLTRAMKFTYYNKLVSLRRYQYNYHLNKFKFENNAFLGKLNTMLSKLYNNNIEFNIINQKSPTLNSDILTDMLTLKIRREKANIVPLMKNILQHFRLPKTNRVQEKSGWIKTSSTSLLENKYKNSSLISILNKNNLNINESCSLNELLKEISNYSSKSFILKGNTNSLSSKQDYNNISNLIFNSIKYKNLEGVRLQAKGRLSRPGRADRSQIKVGWKGGLKNIDASYKGLSTTTYRGFYKPNISYSVSNSKRSAGAFAIRGWISGK